MVRRVEDGQSASTVDATPSPRAALDPLTEEERFRLFSWTTSDNRRLHLAILRVFDDARSAYEVRLRPMTILERLPEQLAELDPAHDASAAKAAHEAEPPAPGEEARIFGLSGDFQTFDAEQVLRALESLHGWGLLELSQDASRVASIEEYKRRRPLYQFTEFGFRSYRSVESVLAMRPGEGQLQRFAFGAINDDLTELASAVEADDAVRAHRLLYQLDGLFRDMTERAGQFYVFLGHLTQQSDTSPEVFLELKDRLLGYLQDFLGELQRHRPLIVAAVARIRDLGVDRLVELVSQADKSPFVTPVERDRQWRLRWDGLVDWFVPRSGAARTAADDLDRATTTAITDLSSLLRRLVESRSRGISRDSELRYLARWFSRLPAESDAHALFGVTFGLTPARHLSSIDEHVNELTPPSASWWEASPVVVPQTLRERGQHQRALGAPPLPDVSAATELARRRHESDVAATEEASQLLAVEGIAIELDDQAFALVRSLLSRAARVRVPVKMLLDGPNPGGSMSWEGEARGHGLVLRLVPVGSGETSVISSTRGALHVDGFRVELDRLEEHRVEDDAAKAPT